MEWNEGISNQALVPHIPIQSMHEALHPQEQYALPQLLAALQNFQSRHELKKFAHRCKGVVNPTPHLENCALPWIPDPEVWLLFARDLVIGRTVVWQVLQCTGMWHTSVVYPAEQCAAQHGQSTVGGMVQSIE